MLTEESSLTCIDLTNSDIRQSALLLKEACLDSGFFYVINHGISEQVMDKTFEQSKKFFALPLEEKMKVLRNEKHRGYTPFPGDPREAYYIGVELPKDDPQCDQPFFGPNPWPDNDVLPGWRETMEKCHQELLRVCKAIVKIMALALDLNVDYFDSPEMMGKPISTLGLLHYEGKSDPSKGIYGVGEHTDHGLMPLITTDCVMGLEICKDTTAEPQKWEYVPLSKGALVLNMGNIMKRWTNGIFKSTLHRIISHTENQYSIMFFMEPSHDCLIECFPTFHSKNNLPKYPPIKCSTYLAKCYEQEPAASSSRQETDLSG